MKTKILSALLGISLLLMVILIIYMIKVPPTCERVHIDDINRSREIKYLDEEMAREIADLVLGIENPEEDTDYNVEITFDEQGYKWVVRYVPAASEGDESITVSIRKDNGIITLDSSK